MTALVVALLLQQDVDLLGDESIEVRDAAEERLEKLGRRALPQLRKAEHHHDLEARVRIERRLAAILDRKSARILLVAAETGPAVLGLYRQIEADRNFRCDLWIGEPRLPDLLPYDGVVLFDEDPSEALIAHVRDSGWGMLVISARRATEWLDAAAVEAGDELFEHIPLPDGKGFDLPRIDRVGKPAEGRPVLRAAGSPILAISERGHGRVARSSSDALWRTSTRTADGRYAAAVTRELLIWLTRLDDVFRPWLVKGQDSAVVLVDEESAPGDVVWCYRGRRCTGKTIVTKPFDKMAVVDEALLESAESGDSVWIFPKN